MLEDGDKTDGGDHNMYNKHNRSDFSALINDIIVEFLANNLEIIV